MALLKNRSEVLVYTFPRPNFGKLFLFVIVHTVRLLYLGSDKSTPVIINIGHLSYVLCLWYWDNLMLG